MATYSQYKNLELPATPEHYDISVFNRNNVVIDSELHKLDLKNQSQDEAFATKEELDDSINNLTSIVSNKVDHVSGKGLSANDFTDEKSEKLEGIAANANHTIYTNNLLATIPGTALDAMQGKALDDKGAQMSVYKGEDGNLHFRDWTGADTVIPFSGIDFSRDEFIIPNIQLTFYTRNIWNGGESSTSNITFDVSNKDSVKVKTVSLSASYGHSASVTYKTDNGNFGTLTSNTMIDVSNSNTLIVELNCSNPNTKTGTSTAIINDIIFV